MQIQGLGPIHGPQPINSPNRPPAGQPTGPANQSGVVDQLEISHEADLASRLSQIPEIRSDRVSELRAEIQSGAYETDDKLNLAVDRLLDELA